MHIGGLQVNSPFSRYQRAGLARAEVHYADGKFISVASLEPQFYDNLIEKAGLDRKRFSPHVFRWKIGDDVPAIWAELKSELAAVIRKKTREERCEIMEGTDICFAPVLTLEEAPRHPHNRERRSFVKVGGSTQSAPAPRFSETPPADLRPGVLPGANTREILLSAGFSNHHIDRLISALVLSPLPPPPPARVIAY